MDKNSKEVKSQSVTMATIIGKAIEAIVAYITIWFFKPLWEKLVKWWKGNNESNN